MSFQKRDRWFVLMAALCLTGIILGAELESYKGRSVIDVPTGAGGVALRGNQVVDADRIGTYVGKAGAPDANDDASGTNGNGAAYLHSVWQDTDTNRFYRCVDTTATAAVWREAVTGSPQIEIVPPGSTVQAIIDDITDATAAKPYVVVVPPGVFDEQVTLQDYVSLRGSGIGVTIITHDGQDSDNRGTIIPADGVVISNMTIKATGALACVGIATYGLVGLEDISFRVENCHIDAVYDIIYLDQQGIICRVYDCTGTTEYDGYTIVVPAQGGSTDCTAKFYIHNCTVMAANTSHQSNGEYAWSICESAEFYLYNPVLISTSTSTAGVVLVGLQTRGVMRVYNPDITMNTNTTDPTWGVMAGVATVDMEIHGGRIVVTNAGLGASVDVYQANLAVVHAYGTRLENITGTVVGSYDVSNTLTATAITSVGAVTGASITDGTATITAGNFDGADIDITAGTGTYTSSGAIEIGSDVTTISIGDGAAIGTVNPAIVIDRTVATSGANAHGFTDESDYILSGGTDAANSFDIKCTVSGTANYNHYLGFQSNPRYASTGTIDNLGSFSSILQNTGAGIVSLATGYKYNVITNTGGGAITAEYGFWVEDTLIGTTKYAFYDQGSNDSLLTGRLGVGIVPATGDNVLSVSGGTNGSSNWFSVLNNNDKEVFSAYTDNDGDGVVNIKNKLAANKIALNSAGASYFNGGDLGVGETSPNAKLDVNGTTRLGDSETNYVAVGATGNQSFAGSAGFYPRTLAQDAEPAAGTGATQVDSGEFLIWVDTNDSNKVYGVYNYGGAVVTILLT